MNRLQLRFAPCVLSHGGCQSLAIMEPIRSEGKCLVTTNRFQKDRQQYYNKQKIPSTVEGNLCLEPQSHLDAMQKTD